MTTVEFELDEVPLLEFETSAPLQSVAGVAGATQTGLKVTSLDTQARSSLSRLLGMGGPEGPEAPLMRTVQLPPAFSNA